MSGGFTLYWAPTSPFARLVTVAAHELGVFDQLNLVEASVETIIDVVAPVNPLAQIPTLVVEDGTAIYDSPVIVAYLNTRFNGSLCGEGEAQWSIATRTSAALGIMEATVAGRHLALQPDGSRPDDFVARLDDRRDRALDYLATLAGEFSAPPQMDAIAAACALGYLDYRFPSVDWRAAREPLATWYAAFAEHPSMSATAPPV